VIDVVSSKTPTALQPGFVSVPPNRSTSRRSRCSRHLLQARSQWAMELIRRFDFLELPPDGRFGPAKSPRPRVLEPAVRRERPSEQRLRACAGPHGAAGPLGPEPSTCQHRQPCGVVCAALPVPGQPDVGIAEGRSGYRHVSRIRRPQSDGELRMVTTSHAEPPGPARSEASLLRHRRPGCDGTRAVAVQARLLLGSPTKSSPPFDSLKYSGCLGADFPEQADTLIPQLSQLVRLENDEAEAPVRMIQ
jgi:hypothetical protein